MESRGGLARLLHDHGAPNVARHAAGTAPPPTGDDLAALGKELLQALGALTEAGLRDHAVGLLREETASGSQRGHVLRAILTGDRAQLPAPTPAAVVSTPPPGSSAMLPPARVSRAPAPALSPPPSRPVRRGLPRGVLVLMGVVVGFLALSVATAVIVRVVQGPDEVAPEAAAADVEPTPRETVADIGPDCQEQERSIVDVHVELAAIAATLDPDVLTAGFESGDTPPELDAVLHRVYAASSAAERCDARAILDATLDGVHTADLDGPAATVARSLVVDGLMHDLAIQLLYEATVAQEHHWVDHQSYASQMADLVQAGFVPDDRLDISVAWGDTAAYCLEGGVAGLEGYVHLETRVGTIEPGPCPESAAL